MQRAPSLRSMLNRINRIPVITLAVVVLLAVLYRAWITQQTVQEIQQARIEEISRLSEFYLQETVYQLGVLGGIYHKIAPESRAAVFAEVRRAYPRFTAFYVVDANGVVILEDTTGISLLGLDLSGEPFFVDPLSRREVFFSDPDISLVSGKVVLLVVMPLQEQNQFDGFLVAELDLYYLQQVINEIGSKGEDITFIVDNQGYLVAHPNTSWVQEQRHMADLELVRLGQAGQTGSDLFYDEMLEQWVYGSAGPMTNGWTVVSKLPVWQALQPMYGILAFGLVAFLGSLTAFRWAQHYSVQRIRQPIAELAGHADALACGEERELPQAAEGEFEEAARLRSSFVRMFQAVQERTAELEQANQDLARQIEERKRAEEAVQELNDELEERVADRTSQLELAVEELDAFAYSVSHDLRAPLRAIDGFSQAVLEDFGERMDETGRSFLGRVKDSVQRMRLQIDALLNLSRLSRTEMYREEVNLSEMAQEILRDLAEAEPHRQVRAQVKPDILVQGDANLLRAALGNLLSNAWKFSTHTPQAVIEFGCEGYGEDSPVFFVRDNGAGFEPSQSHRLFLPFQRLHSDEEFEGTGIGLATVQRVIHRHSGRLWAEGAPGKGACFYFTLLGGDTACGSQGDEQ